MRKAKIFFTEISRTFDGFIFRGRIFSKTDNKPQQIVKIENGSKVTRKTKRKEKTHIANM